MSETGDSGHDLGFCEIAKLPGQTPFRVRFVGCDRGDLPDSRSGLIMGDLGKDSLFEPVEQVVTRALCNVQAQFRSWLQLFLVYRGADRCEDAKPIREFCKS